MDNLTKTKVTKKFKGDIKKKDFYNFYKSKCINKLVDNSTYNKFINSLLKEFGEKIVTESLELKLTGLGLIRVRTKKLNILNKQGNFNKLKVDWASTWAYWHDLYPDLSRDQIKEISNKKVLYHDNEHTNGEFYEHFWDKSSKVKYIKFFKFIPSRQYSRLIAKIVKTPNRKVFYYE